MNTTHDQQFHRRPLRRGRCITGVLRSRRFALRPLWFRGQSTAEYAVLFGVVIAAIVAMQVYVKRGINARLKDASNSATSAVATNLTTTASLSLPISTLPKDLQYEPYYASSNYEVQQSSDRTEKEEAGGVVKREGIREGTLRAGWQKTGAAQ